MKHKRENTEVLRFMDSLKKEYNTPITKREFMDSLSHCNNTATGEDRVHYSMLKNLSENGLNYLRKFYNIIFLKGFFPRSWREAVVVNILKPGCDPSDPDSYRPISLISCLSKLLEIIINKRLIWFLEKNNILDINQNGFRKRRGPIDNLTTLVTEIQHAFLAKKYHVTVFLDLAKAYDTCWKQYVLKQLKLHKLSGCLPMYISNFMYNRSIKVNVNNVISDSYNIELGIPQGSALSATLFLIAVNSMSKCIKSFMSKSFFVDDARVSIVTNNLSHC